MSAPRIKKFKPVLLYDTTAPVIGAVAQNPRELYSYYARRYKKVRPDKIGTFVRRARVKGSLTADDMSAYLVKFGVPISPEEVSRIERGKIPDTLYTWEFLTALATAFQVSVTMIYAPRQRED